MISFSRARAWLKRLSFTCSKLGKNPILKIVIGAYIMLISGMVLLYCGAWIYQFKHDAATLADLLAIIDKVTDANALALITFIGGCLVDINGNGMPDALEQNTDKGEINNDM